MAPRHLRPLALLWAALLVGVSLLAALPAGAQGTPPSQRITIETPGPGTQVGSPVVITGNVARLPAGARLLYSVLASDGRQLGGGSFAVPGDPGQPALFLASLSFAEPLDGDTITLQLIDQEPATGAVLATASLTLITAPIPQRITIESPGPGVLVGNPVVVTGRTARYPAAGVLGYAIYDRAGTQVGGGVFPVVGSPLEGGRFAATLGFLYPAAGGPLQIDLYDQDPLTGVFPASATLLVRTLPLSQQLSIATPAFGTQVGSPVVITGRAALYPAAGVLQYRITDAQGATLGAGSFVVQGAPGDGAEFVASLGFQPPAAPGLIRATVFEVDARGIISASASVDMRWGP